MSDPQIPAPEPQPDGEVPAIVVAYDGADRTVTLRFDHMPCAAIGEQWTVTPVEP